jgi:hypothetical protein
MGATGGGLGGTGFGLWANTASCSAAQAAENAVLMGRVKSMEKGHI